MLQIRDISDPIVKVTTEPRLVLSEASITCEEHEKESPYIPHTISGETSICIHEEDVPFLSYNGQFLNQVCVFKL